MARAGEEVDLAARPVEVNSIRLIKNYYKNEKHNILIRVHCSRGTYIRSLAFDIGKELGCGAHLSYLLRERVGKWDSSHAFPYWKLEKGIPFEKDYAFTKFEDVLSFPKIIVNKEKLFAINNGQSITKRDIASVEATNEEISNIFQIFSPDKKLIAIYSNNKSPIISSNEFKLLPLRVFHENEN